MWSSRWFSETRVARRVLAIATGTNTTGLPLIETWSACNLP